MTKPRRVPNKAKRKVYQDAVHWIISDALKRRDWHCGKPENELPNLIGSLVRQVKNHPHRDALVPVGGEQSSEESFFIKEPKECFMFSKRGMLRAVHDRSPKSSGSYGLKYWPEGLVCCTYGTHKTVDNVEMRRTDRP